MWNWKVNMVFGHSQGHKLMIELRGDVDWDVDEVLMIEWQGDDCKYCPRAKAPEGGPGQRRS
jgi:hypothetical protein